VCWAEPKAVSSEQNWAAQSAGRTAAARVARRVVLKADCSVGKTAAWKAEWTVGCWAAPTAGNWVLTTAVHWAANWAERWAANSVSHWAGRLVGGWVESKAGQRAGSSATNWAAHLDYLKAALRAENLAGSTAGQ